MSIQGVSSENIDERVKSKVAASVIESKSFVKESFTRVDADASGSLDKKEAKVLVEDCINAFINNADKLAEKIISANLEAMKQTLPAEMIEMYTTMMRGNIPAISQAFAKSFGELLKNVDALSEDFFKQLDANGDGLVSKQEFHQRFMDTVNKAFKIDDLAGKSPVAR